MPKIQCLFADHVLFLCERNRVVFVMVAAAAATTDNNSVFAQIFVISSFLMLAKIYSARTTH